MQRDPIDPEVRVERVTELPRDFGELITLSLREDFGAMQRTREEWDSGGNRFDRPGEILFEARAGSRLVGICGLNRDPYAQSSEIGRVRRLYVDPAFRRRGIGWLLVSRVVEHASRSFARLRLRTLRADADQFYVALGFSRVAGEPEVTHEMETLASTVSG